MEQLNVVTQQDNERIFNILSDLLSKDKAFQIMITVPAGDKNSGDEAKKLFGADNQGIFDSGSRAHDLEKSACTYQRLPVSEGSNHHVGRGYGNAEFHYENPLPVDCKEVSDNAKPCGTCDKTCY